MASEEATFRHSGTLFPLPTATTNPLLQDADPALYHTLAYLSAMVTAYAGTRLLAQAAAAGVSTVTAAVAYTLPDNPTDYLTEQQIKFPLLAVYRVRSKRKPRTRTWRESVQEWKAAYVLPPMTSGQREAIVPVLHAIESIIDNRLWIGFDPGYLAGAAILYGASYANLEYAELTDAEYTAWEAGRDLVFPAVVMTLDIREKDMPVTGAFDPLDRVDTSLDVADSDAGTDTLADVIQQQIDTDP